PDSFKKANVVPIHKKQHKTLVENYRPISLLSILSKIFEKIVFKYLFNYFKDNFILSLFQSGFQPGISTVTQLLEVYHHFCKAVDDNKEICVIFLDISKAFNRVWHKGLLFKLKQCGIRGKMFEWFVDYLDNRFQRVVINGQASSWLPISAGVPQGSVLGPLLFLVYINDIVHVVRHCKIRLFADDTCLFIEVDNRDETSRKINHDLNDIQSWADQWLITFSPVKTKSLIISNKPDLALNPSLYLNNIEIEEVNYHKYLGLSFSQNLKWSQHIHDISIAARKRLSLMMPLKFKLSRKSLEIMYKSFVLPSMEYGNVVWGGSFANDISKLEKIQIDAMRLVTGATARSNINSLYNETCWLSVSQRHEQAVAIMMYKILSFLSPSYLQNLLPTLNSERHGYTLRNRNDL
ncbi:MAG: reverse transcriptase family protein, partial [Desulfobacteraceae bacterium]|nr:reverse transcriptase family protein [Desulfobacteraceae bacterium]